MIRNYDYKNLRENLFNLKRFFENLGKLIKIKSRSCIENLFNFISINLDRKILLKIWLKIIRSTHSFLKYFFLNQEGFITHKDYTCNPL